MLRELRISGCLALGEVAVEFGAGTTTITGESGAGKSMLLRAIGWLGGAPADDSVVAHGAKECRVEGLFEVSRAALAALPEQFHAIDGELVVSRSIAREGRSKVFINGHLASVSTLRVIPGHLFTVCSQHQQVRLLNPSEQHRVLNLLLGCQEDAALYVKAFQEVRTLRERVAGVQAALAAWDVACREAHETVAELTALHLKPGVREELEEELRRAKNIVAVRERGAAIEALLSRDGELLTGLRHIGGTLRELTRLGCSVNGAEEQVALAEAHLEEVERLVRVATRDSGLDEGEIEARREQLAEIARCERKYQRRGDDLLALLRSQEEFLSQGAPRADELAALESELRGAVARLAVVRDRLSAARRAGSGALERTLTTALVELGIRHAEVQVGVEEFAEPTELGAERLSILLATQKNEPPKPLQEVASGGELSRVLLALLVEQSRAVGEEGTFIFDEVDAGISGQTSLTVGRLLRALGERCQVFAVTHLPAVAAAGHRQIVVAPGLIRDVKGTERVNEISSLIAGEGAAKGVRATATQLLSSYHPRGKAA